MTKNLILRPEKCVSCRTCELVCSFSHFKQFNPTLSAVAVIDYPEDVITVPLMCLQCDEPACAKVCPVNAITKCDDGKVSYDDEKCMVCKLCVQACPMGSITYSTQVRKLIRCDLCGDEALCAEWCPTKAIIYSDSVDDNERQRAVANNFREALKEGVA